jgi:flotillin
LTFAQCLNKIFKKIKEFIMILGYGTLVVVLVVVVFITFLMLLSRYKVIPSDKVIVVFGLVGKGRSSVCQHGGARFILPLVQSHQFLDLTPMTIEISLENALSKQNIRVSVPSRFTIGISTDPHIMQAAAERLLSMGQMEREDNARDIIFGQLRATIATMNIEEINSDREAFEEKIQENVEVELRKIGLRLINVNITDISDESGYIDALGQKAASEAINRAKVEVAEQNREGAIGEAEAKREERIRVAKANASAIEGENLAKVSIAQSDAAREEAVAESARKVKAAQLVQDAKALEEGYDSERKAELTRKAKEEASMQANVIVPAEIAKQQALINADAEAAKVKKLAEGEASRIKILAEGEAEKIKTLADAEAIRLAKQGEGHGKEVELEMTGRAEGNKMLLLKQAEGLKSVIASTGGDPNSAAMLMIVDKLPSLVATQVEAIKNLKIDKITVWDSGRDANGRSSTSNFLSSLVTSLPPLQDLLKTAGITLPEAILKEQK